MRIEKCGQLLPGLPMKYCSQKKPIVYIQQSLEEGYGFKNPAMRLEEAAITDRTSRYPSLLRARLD